ncbi:hypothetical protein [Halodesulfurarchaeum sp.]|uniref:hypothetical protein n=1 Tax=Halodesulfurarchaeum sp. TaxID=1980530 RepID=UPI002FC2B8CB
MPKSIDRVFFVESKFLDDLSPLDILLHVYGIFVPINIALPLTTLAGEFDTVKTVIYNQIVG